MLSLILFILFGLFLAIQLFYFLYYFSAIPRVGDKFSPDTHKPVSVIVCARNELPNLQKLLPVLLTQNYHNYEIVIVNDRSEDGSYEYLEEERKKSKKIRPVHIDSTPDMMDAKKYAITLGIKAANHPYLLFTDADTLPVKQNWILQMQSRFSDKVGIVLGVSQYEVKKGLLNYFIQYETLYTAIQYISFALRGMPYMGVGRNLAYHKDLFLNNKGFHPYMNIVGGDDDLFISKVAEKGNVAVITSIESQTISAPKTTWKEWYIQKTRHLSVGKYYKPGTKFLLGLLNFSHIGFYALFFSIIFQEDYFNFGIAGLLLRWIVISIIFSTTAKKIRYGTSGWNILLFDIVYPIYFVFVGWKAIRTKRIKWK